MLAASEANPHGSTYHFADGNWRARNDSNAPTFRFVVFNQNIGFVILVSMSRQPAWLRAQPPRQWPTPDEQELLRAQRQEDQAFERSRTPRVIMGQTQMSTMQDRRAPLTAEVTALERQQGAAVLNGKTFDAKPLIAAREALEALDTAETEQSRRDREDAQRKRVGIK